MYIHRLAEKNVSNPTEKVLIILGARQVGKTTLVKRYLEGKKSVFMNLDIEVDKARLMAVGSLPPIEAWKAFGSADYIVIDEAQRLPEVGRIVKGWYDSQIPARIILLGSSSLDLLNQSAESLTGRNEKLFLPPLLFKEIIAAQPWYTSHFSDADIYQNFAPTIHSLLLQSIFFGNYPETITVSDKESFLLNLSSDYLLKDVLQIGLVKNPETIKRLLMLLAYQIGSEVSVNELALNLAISRQTVERYLELLEQTFVIFRLPSFSTNPRKEISKSQKIYFWDTGVRNAILKDFSTNEKRPDIGALWENWVIAEAAKQNMLTGNKKNLYFWRTRTKSEVDLVIKEKDKLSAYEIKWHAKTMKRTVFESMYQASVILVDSSQPLVQF